MDSNISTTLQDDGVLIARIDMPGRAMNVFSVSMMDSLERLLDHVDATPAVKGVVITSGKPSFIAGADLEMVRKFTEQARTASHKALHDMCGRLGRLFCRLERSGKPYVAAINGLALGGGLEMTLACHERVVADDRRVQLGLPEIKLGLLPGAGGTQRLPRLIDPLKAMRMLLGGNPVAPAEALEIGLVDEIAPSEGLIEHACARARALRCPQAPWNVPGKGFSSAPFDFNREDVFAQIRTLVGVSEYQFARYPAYATIMKCVIGGWNRQIEEASRWEMDCFVDLIQNPVAGNMVVTMFLNRQRAAKEGMASPALADARVAVSGWIADEVATLLKAGKAPLVDAAELTEGDIHLVVAGTDASSGLRIEWLHDSGSACARALQEEAGIWLSEATEHGRCAEIVASMGGQADALIDAGRKLAQWLRAIVLVTRGNAALLPRLEAARDAANVRGCAEDEVVFAVALVAARAWEAGEVTNPAFADVAAVTAGVAPAWSGGPFRQLGQMTASDVQERAARLREIDRALFVLPEHIETLLQALKES